MKQTLLALAVALAAAACGGGGDDSAPTQPPPTQTTLTLVNVLVRDSHIEQGPNVAEHRYGMQGPQYTMPAKAVSAEVCVAIEWVQRAAAGATLTLVTSMSGDVTPSDAQVGDTFANTSQLADYALTATRCGQLDPTRSDRPVLSMRMSATSAVMSRYDLAVRWTIKAVQ